MTHVLDPLLSWIRKYPYISAGTFAVLLGYVFFIQAPFSFPERGVFVVEEGDTVTEVARNLEEQNYIRSSAFFSIWVRLTGGDSGILSETYTFDDRANMFTIAGRLIQGDTGTPLIKITFPEGSTVREMANILDRYFDEFDTSQFLAIALPQEGYLFPDTYRFSPRTTPERVVETMRATFDANVATIQEEIDAFDVPLSDVVIMASLLEKEARRFETRQTIAGILWSRIEIGMPLQVDAVFGYILQTETFSPTFDQLEIDSPYNTYQNLGLPPGAIANPGLDSMLAAVTPIETPYLFYLTGADGRMYYAETFDRHVANRRFLR